MRGSSSLIALLSVFVLLVPASSEAQRRRPGRRAPAGWFTIVNANGLCLDVHGADGNRDGARVVFWPCHGRANQQWRFDRGMLMSALGKCLDVHGADGNRNGAHVQLWSCHGRANQRWRARRRGTLTSALGGCLDITGGLSARPGTRAMLWRCRRAPSQRFRMTPVRSRRPSPVARAPRPMNHASFATLLARVRAQSFSSERIAAVGDAASAWFTAAQITALVELMSFSSSKLRVIELLAPHLVDRHNGGAIIDALTFSSSKDNARQILARYTRRRR